MTIWKRGNNMTTTEAAALLCMTRAWLWRLINRGTIKAEKRGRDWWIEAKEIERYRIERRKPGRPPAYDAATHEEER